MGELCAPPTAVGGAAWHKHAWTRTLCVITSSDVPILTCALRDPSMVPLSCLAGLLSGRGRYPRSAWLCMNSGLTAVTFNINSNPNHFHPVSLALVLRMHRCKQAAYHKKKSCILLLLYWLQSLRAVHRDRYFEFTEIPIRRYWNDSEKSI